MGNPERRAFGNHGHPRVTLFGRRMQGRPTARKCLGQEVRILKSDLLKKKKVRLGGFPPADQSFLYAGPNAISIQAEYAHVFGLVEGQAGLANFFRGRVDIQGVGAWS